MTIPSIEQSKDTINAFKAIYSDQGIDEYHDNPFIEALPPILTEEEAIERLTYLPQYKANERNLAPELRYHCIQRLFRYFEPIDRHVELEQRISRIIRQGYLARNPLEPQYVTHIREPHNITSNGPYDLSNDSGFCTSASGMTVIGISGMGKTTAINRVLSLYPQLIIHSEYKSIPLKQFQIVWLKLDCPFDGSLKGLCINFFQAIDGLMGTSYFKKYGNPRNSVDAMLPRMSQIAKLFGLGVLIIDEIQHLNMAHSGGPDKMLNFFVTLVNTIGVPVILIGTTKALSVVQGEFRQARRGSGQGDMAWERFNNDDYWDLFIEGMWNYQWTTEKVPLTKELKDVLYDESQGIIDIAIKLYVLAQWRSISLREEAISEESIRSAAKESLQLVRPMLNALRSGREKEIMKYDDIRPVEMETCFERYTVKPYYQPIIKNDGNIEKNVNNEDYTEKLYQINVRLLDVGIAEKIAQESAIQAIESYRDGDIQTLTKAALEIALQMKTTQKGAKKPRRNKPILEPEDLRCIVTTGKKQGKSAYDTLREKGIIKSPAQEFIEA